MNILHVTSTFDLASGGPVIIATRLAAAQAKQGHNVSVIAYAQESDSGASTREQLDAIPGGELLTLYEINPTGTTERFTASRVKNQLEKIINDIDFLHIHGIWCRIVKSAADAARKHNKPYTIVPHGMLDPWSLSQKTLKKKLALKLGYKKMLDDARFLHLGNTDEQNLIKPLNIHSKGELIPNGLFIDEIEPAPTPGAFYKKHPELDNKPFVLFLSRLHYKKGLDHLAQAFTVLAGHDSEVRLVVAGPDDGVKDDFVQRIEQANLTNRVHLIGPIYHQEKLEALHDATCFCLPSRQEGFSIAITEALGCGLPVVITDGCHYGIAGEVGAGEVCPLDGQAVGEALVRVVGDPQGRENMSAAGRKLIRDRFTWPKVAQQVIGLYEKYA